MFVEKHSDPNTLLGRNLTIGLLDHVGKAIVTGFYDNKSFPTEAQLADQYKVSRSVTREAVKMLTAKGLLTARCWPSAVKRCAMMPMGTPQQLPSVLT